MSYQQDSPLSIAASITGILTFVAAVFAGFWARAITLKSAIDTQAEVSLALEKIEFLEEETNMLNNAFLASQIRHPDRKYGVGDFKYFQNLYGSTLQRMRMMDHDIRSTATLVTGEDQYENLSRVKLAANWMAHRDRLHKQIEERKAESSRVFQIQLAMLSAKIDELSYHQKAHNVSCSVIGEEAESEEAEGTERATSARSIPISVASISAAIEEKTSNYSIHMGTITPSSSDG